MLETILESTSIKKYQHLRSERFEHVIYIYIYHFIILGTPSIWG